MNRLFYFDNLRAFLIITVIFGHSILFLAPYSLVHDWSVRNTSTNPVYFYIDFFIYLFAMPVFYLIAGYFANYTFSRIGAWGFIKHRLRSIGFPFLIAVSLLTLYNTGFFITYYKSGLTITWLNIYHIFGYISWLWFLWYLLILYILILCFQLIRQQFFTVKFQIAPWLLISCFILYELFLLLCFPIPIMRLPLFIGITLPSLPIYFGFILFGWLLFERQDVLELIRHCAGRFLLISIFIGFSLLVYFLTHRYLFANHFLASVYFIIKSITVWLLVLGIIGGFYRWLNRRSKVLSYYADASYWLYLIQVPVILITQTCFYFINISAILKFICVFSLSMLILTLTYAVFVRRTFIGVLLNGKRG